MPIPRRKHFLITILIMLVSGCGGSSNVQPSHPEFDYMNGEGAASTISPLASIKADEAYAKGYTGANQTIAIVDSSFDTSHQEISNKSTNLLTFGTLGTASHNSYHGLAVSSIAAGAKDGKGIHGVAYDASLHLSDYTYYGGQTNLPDRWAQLTNDAASHNAIAQNNSWGLNELITTVTSYIQTNSLNNAQGVAHFLNQGNYTASESAVNNYVTALDNFQNTGVIVYAISNDMNFNDADFQAALPELFPSLQEAWLTVTNIEVTGSAGNYQYSRQSAKCGSTAEYCIGADGEDIRTAKSSPSNDSYDDSVSGTSFTAPQVSGGIAVLKQAFPNHTPAQLVERLLASANNDFFTSSTYTTFGNGVMHYYNDEFGHGFMDLAAALEPIVVTGTPRMVTGSNIQQHNQYQLHNSQLHLSSSFGDSIANGLAKQTVYVYDDLNGGFSYPLVYSLENSPHSAKEKLIKQLDNTNSISFSKQTPHLNTPYNTTTDWQLHRTLGAASLHTNINATSTETTMPRISIVWQSPHYLPTSTAVEAGIHHATDELLGLKGSGALNLQGSTGTSSFANLSLRHHLTNNWQLDVKASAAVSQLNTPHDSLIQGFHNITSNAYSLSAKRNKLFTQDQLAITVSQPHRLNSGTLQVNIASLADTNGNIQQQTQSLHLATSGRQLDLQLDYHLWLTNNLQLGLHHLSSLEPNHIATALPIHQQTISLQGDVFAAALSYDESLQQPSVVLRWQGDL